MKRANDEKISLEFFTKSLGATAFVGLLSPGDFAFYIQGFVMAHKRTIDVIDEIREDAEFRWEALRRNDDYKREYKGLGLSKKALKAIYCVASNPYEVFCHGNLFIVSFCELWGVRYPKNPDENFKSEEDRSLFYEHWPVRVLPHHAKFEALGADAVLQIMKFYLERRPLVTHNGEVTKWYEGLSCDKDRLLYAEAVELVRRNFQGLEKYVQKKHEAGEIMFLVNANYQKEIIEVLIGQALDSLKKGLPKKRRRIPRVPGDWRTLFNVWDLKLQGMSYSEIAEAICYDGDVRSIGNWLERVRKMIERAGLRRDARRDKDGNYLCWGDFS